jgi:hypothetical protein
MKIRSVGAEFHAAGQTDRHDEANSRFSQFCGRTQKLSLFFKYTHSRSVFLNRRAAARYRALASIIPGRDNLSF